MLKNITTTFLILGFITLLSSCSKRHNTTKTISDFHLSERGKILLNKVWREESIELIHTDSLQKDITKQFMKSDLDDVVIFFEDGTYKFDEGPTKARTESAQIYQNGVWRISEKGELLFYDLNNHVTAYFIQDLTPNKLILTLPIKSKNYYYLMTYYAIKQKVIPIREVYLSSSINFTRPSYHS